MMGMATLRTLSADAVGVASDPGRQRLSLVGRTSGFIVEMSRHEAENLHLEIGIALAALNVAHSREA